MKKIISLLLALLMLAGLLSTAAFAADKEMTDVIEFEVVESKTSNSGLFTLTTNDVDQEGWYGGNKWHTLTVSALKNSIMITRLEIVLGFNASTYGDAHLSSGVRKESETWEDGKSVTVMDINSPSFSIDGDDTKSWTQYKDIKIYYKCATHDYDENNICRICNQSKCDNEGHNYDANHVCTVCKKTICEAEGHSLDNGFCKFCDYFDETKHEHIFDDNNECRCGKSKCDVNGHNYVSVLLCECCGEQAPEGYVPDSGSALSKGYPEIVFAVGGMAIGVIATLLISRKKKKSAGSASAGDKE